MIRCRMSILAGRAKGRLFNQLLGMIKFYMVRINLSVACQCTPQASLKNHRCELLPKTCIAVSLVLIAAIPVLCCAVSPLRPITELRDR